MYFKSFQSCGPFISIMKIILYWGVTVLLFIIFFIQLISKKVMNAQWLVSLAGGGRYIPGGASGTPAPSTGGTDPFTGTGRYVPSNTSTSNGMPPDTPQQPYGADPLTGALFVLFLILIQMKIYCILKLPLFMLLWCLLDVLYDNLYHIHYVCWLLESCML